MSGTPYTARKRSVTLRTRARAGDLQATVGTVGPYMSLAPRGYSRAVPEVSDHGGELDGLPLFWRSAPIAGEPGAPTPLYLHGVPTSSDDWLQFLARSGGLAPDLPGYGRTGKPGHFDYTIAGYERFLERFLELVGVRRVSLVMHDWGVVGLAFAQRHPERVARLVLLNAVPFLPSYRWHRVARVWRTPLLGELAMGCTGSFTLGLASREANVAPGPLPRAWLASVLAHFDQGTQRAILRLYRSSSPEALAAAGAKLGTLSMPALVVWGMRDPYIPEHFARAYTRALPDAALIELPDAGHWPWLDRPDAIARVVEFVNTAPA
jgi:pimeloyl-ACP methyl ester carboxylesterase